MYREAKQRLKDPVLAWADVVNDPERRRRYHQARGKGGLVRVSWAEAVEMIAAAQVHTIKTYGPDRIAGFSPIPAMSMVSHCVGTRFTQLIGGVMTSFYDWSEIHPDWRAMDIFPIISEGALRATLGILNRTVIARRDP